MLEAIKGEQHAWSLRSGRDESETLEPRRGCAILETPPGRLALYDSPVLPGAYLKPSHLNS